MAKRIRNEEKTYTELVALKFKPEELDLIRRATKKRDLFGISQLIRELSVKGAKRILAA